MKQIKHKSAVPLYAAAAVWVLYALLFALHKPIHFIIAAAASAAVYAIASALCPDVVEEIPEEPETTGNEALDKMIAEGKLAISEMRRLNDNIEDAAISDRIDRLEEITSRIFAHVQAEPKKLPQIRKLMNYYLPTTLKLLNTYDRMGEQGIAGENIAGTMERVEKMLDTIEQAFAKQLDSLFGAEALDISTDITVLENMMAREGLVDDPIHSTRKENQSAPKPELSMEEELPYRPQVQVSVGNEEDETGGITLEL